MRNVLYLNLIHLLSRDKKYYILDEDFLISGMIFNSLKEAKKYLVKQVEIEYKIDRENAIHDLEVDPEDVFLKEFLLLSKTDDHILSIEKNGCWNYWEARVFRIFEYIIEDHSNQL